MMFLGFICVVECISTLFFFFKLLNCNPLEKEMATYSSILAWKIPWTEEPGGPYIVHGVTQSWTQLDFTSLFRCATFAQLLVVVNFSSFSFLIIMNYAAVNLKFLGHMGTQVVAFR